MKAWLKGGLIGLAIVIILLFVFFIFILDSGACLRIGYEPVNCKFNQIFSFPLLIGSLPIGLILLVLNMDQSITSQIWKVLFSISNIIFYFLVGSLIGLIIGKIKSKKKK